MTNNLAQAFLGGGCFWCTEAVFKRLNGVESVIPGYAGGDTPNPSYEKVSGGQTGHAEVIKVDYDPRIIDYQTLLKVFFTTHNPTTLNRQGNDVGSQYRSIILFTNEQQKKQAENFISKLTKDEVFAKPIVTEVKQLEDFYPAEDYHYDYYAKNKNQPYCLLVINPKLKKLKKEYKEYLKNN